MNLTSQPLFTFGANIRGGVSKVTQLTATALGRRDARFKRRLRSKRRIAHSQRRKNIFPGKLIQRHSTRAPHYFTQRNVIDVAVNETRARRIAQRLADEPLD